MELKPPKPKKKSNMARLISWGKMFKTPLLILLLLGTTNCENDSDSDISDFSNSNPVRERQLSSDIDLKLSKLNLEQQFSSEKQLNLLNLTNSEPFAIGKSESNSGLSKSIFGVDNDTSVKHLRHRHHRQSDKEKLSEIRYLRRHLNKEIVNFIMSDVLMDGEVENRVHFNGITAKETYVGADGDGLRLRQLTDGRHLIQVIYNQNGDIQDCEYITQGKSARNFLKTLRKELKLALDEENYRILQKTKTNEVNVDSFGESSNIEKFYRHFGNVTFRILRKGQSLPQDVASWFNYDNLKMECLKRHEEMKYMMESNTKVGGVSLARSRRSFRENFILPGTKWCGKGQLAEDYSELGLDRTEDKCCRAHDNCRMNIGQFRRRFGYFNFRPYTISHCRCDRRFRACLKLADTSVSNMVGKLFFNVVQTKCFILKPVKMCTQRSWWGKCLRRGYMKQAFLRDNLPY